MTLKQKTNQYNELKMEKKKKNHRHLDCDSSGQCTPHSTPLPKPVLWPSPIAGIITNYYIFLLHS